MLALAKPEILVHALFEQAVESIHNIATRERFKGEVQSIQMLGLAYEQAASDGTLGALGLPHRSLATVSAAEMQRLYAYRLRRTGSPGRLLYNKIMTGPAHAICPYCGERRVKSLDHYMPQSIFSVLAVTPTNLVPACSDCNRAKLDYYPDEFRPALLNPYFDNFEDKIWLRAELSQTVPPSITYTVDTSVFDDEQSGARVAKHFEVFELDELYKAHAAQSLYKLQRRIPDLYRNGGPESVRDYLLEEIAYMPGTYLNTWERALYVSLSENAWFYNDYAGGLCAM
jgi:hypothetical protein